MKKVELLAPAGSMESLIAAVNNGADAVYLGGIAFGARAYASNFSREELIEAINFCHVRNVNVYITMNTLIYETEIESALKEVDFYYKNNVDALIIQDLGLFTLIRKHYPDFNIHCSTQMHIHNLNGVKFMKEKGASRVILARETPLKLIKECVETGIEIETFVYGALCVSYSGQCMMSSILQNRSGNRGVCAQHCRLQYRLYDNDKNVYIDSEEYLLSPKDLNLINQIPTLLKTGITSLKIEGRMKRSEYVGLVVKLFRKAIDSYYNNVEYTITNEDLKQLKLLFNRGFTEGKTFDKKDSEFMNPIRPNHIGIKIGNVISFDKNYIHIKLNDDLYQGDGIRILSKKEDFGLIVNKLFLNHKLVNKASKSQVVSIEKKGKVNIGDLVLKTTDYNLNKEIQITNKNLINKIEIKGIVQGSINKPLKLIVLEGNNIIEVSSNLLCQKPIKSKVSFDRIKEQLEKTKDTPFKFLTISNEIIEDIYIPIKTINELRRKALEELTLKKINKYNRYAKKEYILENLAENNSIYTFIELNNIQQLNLIDTSNTILFSNSKDMVKYYNGVNFLGFIVNEDSITFNTEYIMANQIGDLYKQESKMFAGYGLNATNSYAVAFLLENGCKSVCYSIELNENKIRKSEDAFYFRFKFFPNTATFIYGKRDLMITKQNIVYPSISNKDKNIDLNHVYSLENKKKQKFLLQLDQLGFTHILEENPFVLKSYITKSKYLRLTTENRGRIL